MPKIEIDVGKCNGDGTCIEICPMACFELKGEKAVVVNEDDCIVCGACEVQCPNEAITVTE